MTDSAATEPPVHQGTAEIGADAARHLEALLAGRTKVPVERVAEYGSWPRERFHQELEEVNAILKRFAGAVADAMEDPGSAADFLAELDLKLVSRDHDWRTIFSTLKAQTGLSPHHKRILLVRYLQYLGFRKRLVEFIFARHGSLGETRALSSLADPAGLTTIDGEAYLRLPLGETVELAAPGSRPMVLMLAVHRFSLEAPDQGPVVLAEEDGTRHTLRQGRNLVGRHPSADVVVSGGLRQVSRAHLILEWHGERRLTALDISTGGTYVPTAALWGKDRQLAEPPADPASALLAD
jgi:hypothetical protein